MLRSNQQIVVNFVFFNIKKFLKIVNVIIQQINLVFFLIEFVRSHL